MSHVVFTADDNLDGTEVHLLTPTNDLRSRVREIVVASDLYDHVVETVADLPAPAAGFHSLTSGSWAFTSPLALGGNRLNVPAGVTVYLQGFGWGNTISGTAGPLLAVSGVALVENMHFSIPTANAVGVNCFGAYTDLTGCLIESGGDSVQASGASAIDVLVNRCRLQPATGYASFGCRSAAGVGRVRINQSTFESGTDGIAVVANLSYLNVYGVRCVGGRTNFIQRSAGLVTSVSVVGCIIQATNGINWAAANMPAYGLLVMGNSFNCTNDWVAHTPASALVNYKCNNSSGGPGLLTETVIVP